MADNNDDFETRLRQFGLLPPQSAPDNVIPITTNTTATGTNPAYVNAVLQRELDAVQSASEGTRNHTLNRAAFNLSSLVDAGALDEQTVTDALTAAARQAGLPDNEIRATLASARRGSSTKVGARRIPEPTTNGTVLEVTAEDLTGDLTDDEQRDLHSLAVARRAYELRVNDEARQLYASQQAALLGQHAPPPRSLTEFLAVPDEDAIYRIGELLPVGGRALLAAQYKAGKTTMMANLLRSLVDGADFLGTYHTEPVGRVALIDTELDERMLRRWLRTQGIRNTDAVTVVSLRGRLSTFDITNDRARADWAARLAGTDLAILDCLRPCLDSLGLSEDKDAGKFLVAFDALIAEANASEAVVVHHMGHSAERSRGDSRLLDWPDVLWKIVRDRDDEGTTDEAGDRYFSAIGRDVNVGESLLDYTPETGTLMAIGGSRSEKKARGIFSDIIEILSDPANSEGLSRNKLVAKLKAMGNGRDTARKALQMAVDQAVVLIQPGPNRTNLHILNPSRAGD